MRSSVVSSMNLCIDMYIYIIYMSGFKRFFFKGNVVWNIFLVGIVCPYERGKNCREGIVISYYNYNFCNFVV